jgi:hypothetical protein
MVYTALKQQPAHGRAADEDSCNIVTAMSLRMIRRPSVAAIDMENLR